MDQQRQSGGEMRSAMLGEFLVRLVADQRPQFRLARDVYGLGRHVRTIAALSTTAPGKLSYNVGEEAVIIEQLSSAWAKARIGEAAGKGAEIAHQIHAAMGYTREHNLHFSSRRLWAWRDEFGNESFWQMRLGRMVAKQGADALWPMLTAV